MYLCKIVCFCGETIFQAILAMSNKQLINIGQMNKLKWLLATRRDAISF